MRDKASDKQLLDTLYSALQMAIWLDDDDCNLSHAVANSIHILEDLMDIDPREKLWQE